MLLKNKRDGQTVLWAIEAIFKRYNSFDCGPPSAVDPADPLIMIGCTTGHNHTDWRPKVNDNTAQQQCPGVRDITCTQETDPTNTSVSRRADGSCTPPTNKSTVACVTTTKAVRLYIRPFFSSNHTNGCRTKPHLPIDTQYFVQHNTTQHNTPYAKHKTRHKTSQRKIRAYFLHSTNAHRNRSTNTKKETQISWQQQQATTVGQKCDQEYEISRQNASRNTSIVDIAQKNITSHTPHESNYVDNTSNLRQST